MKKWMIVMVVLATIGAACDNLKPGTYRIKGKFVTAPDETVYLVSDVFGQEDSLGKCVLKDNKFEIRGNIDSVRDLALLIDRGRVPVLLEEGIFKIKVNPFKITENCLFEEGGKEQQLLNHYWKLIDSVKTKKKLILQDYQKALFFEDSVLVRKAEEGLRDNKFEMLEVMNKLIKQHPDSYFAAYILYMWRNDFGFAPEQLEICYELLGNKAKQYVPARIVKAKIDNLNY